MQRWSHIKWRSNRLHRENISQHDELPFQLPNKTEGTHQISKSHLPFLSCSISSTLHSPKCSSQNLARLISTVDGWEDPSLTAANRLGRILFDGFTWKAALEVAVANTRNKMLVAFIVIVSGEMFGKDCFVVKILCRQKIRLFLFCGEEWETEYSTMDLESPREF